MMVLFLDFDGVLNSKQHFMMADDKGAAHYDGDLDFADYMDMSQNVNANNMWVLRYILSQLPDLKIVVSSAWGKFYSLDRFKLLFRRFRLDESRLIGITPRKISSQRRDEIRWWLDLQGEKTPGERIAWLALDDHEIFQLGEADKKNEYLTDSWVGVTMNDAFKVIRHFDPDFIAPFFGI
jgi:hypothetical protein